MAEQGPVVAGSANRPAPIVAELGRPETAEETAARKAENSRQHRANQTLRNLIWSLVATLAVVAVLVFVVVRPDPVNVGPVDYATVAEQAQGDIPVPLAAPTLPTGWSANEAELRTSKGVTAWYIGFLTPSGDFIAFSEGLDANPTWTDAILEGKAPTGSVSIGQNWVEYNHRAEKDPGNVAYGLVTDVPGATLVLNGTASDADFATLASALLDSIGQ